MIYIIAAFAAAYVIGSFPSAYVAGKLFKGIDIRKHGSGNVGATNVVRVVGKVPGIIVFIIDLLKGTFCVIVIPSVLIRVFPAVNGKYSLVCILLGAIVVSGHIWTVFLRFKGGKGVATTAGVMAGLAPEILGMGLLIWIIVFFLWRYVSLASILAAVSLPILAIFLGKSLEFIIFTSMLCVVGLFGHRGNIRRLLQGTEAKVSKTEKSQH
ncbi:MAG: glycerol-3-phosphate 1-O-acyltransferase PlsY [Candidatus Omnitrophota bacterium]